jgi:hypothetical protein
MAASFDPRQGHIEQALNGASLMMGKIQSPNEKGR